MSTTPGTAAVLPQESRDALIAAYQAYNEANQVRPGEIENPEARRKATERRDKNRQDRARRLANLAAAGRQAGWPVRALAEPLGVTPERLRQIIKDWGSGARNVRPRFPKYAPPVTQKVVTPRKTIVRSHLTKAEAKELRDLAKDAPHNTGSRPLDSKFRKASERYSALLIEYHDRGVTWGEMAEVTGYTITGLRMRAARHGYGKGAPPSIEPYRGIVIHSKKVEEPVQAAKTPARKTPARKSA